MSRGSRFIFGMGLAAIWAAAAAGCGGASGRDAQQAGPKDEPLDGTGGQRWTGQSEAAGHYELALEHKDNQDWARALQEVDSAKWLERHEEKFEVML